MLTAFLVFAYNLRIPLFLIGIAGVALYAIIAIKAGQTRSLHGMESPYFIEATKRQITSLWMGSFFAFLAAFSWAIPSPTYNIREVVREVKVEVNKPNDYDDLFRTCIKNYGYAVDDKMSRQCHLQALQAINPTPIVKKYVRDSNYKDLFDSCNENYIGGIANIKDGQAAADARLARMQFCHKAAMEGSRTAILAFAKGG